MIAFRAESEDVSSHTLLDKNENPHTLLKESNLSIDMGFPYGLASKESACNVGDLGLIPGLGRYPGEGKGYPLQYWPGEFHGPYSPWGRKESDMTDCLSLSHKFKQRLLNNLVVSSPGIYPPKSWHE